MMINKKTTVRIILLLVLLCLATLSFVACNDSELPTESPIQSIIITTLPKVNYYLGDTFDVRDAKITVYYENGESETVPLDMKMISSFDSNSLGEQIITIFYKNKTTYLSVNVTVAPVYSIQVQNMPRKTTYVIGEDLDVTDMKILVTYSNKRTEIMDVTEEMVVGFSTENEGETEMSVSYGGKYCMATYTVVKRAPDNVEMRLSANFKAAYVVGDELDITGGSFFVHYNDNTSEDLDWVELHRAGKLSYAIDTETSNVFTTSALARTIYVFYNGDRYQTVVTVNALRPSELIVMSRPDDQILKGKENFAGGQLHVRYNSKQNGYYARVSDATEEARRTYTDGKWSEKHGRFFVFSNDEYKVSSSTYSADETYYVSLEEDFVSRYEQRRQYLYVKVNGNIQKAPESYDETIVYYLPSNVKVFDFDDPVYVRIEKGEFNIEIAGDYTIRLIVDRVYIDYVISVVAPSPDGLEIIPSLDNVNKDPETGAYYVYQDETLEFTDWFYKIHQNNDTYAIISTTGTDSARVYNEMYVGTSFVTNHSVGVYDYDFSMVTATGITLSCTVPIEFRQRSIVSARVTFPTRTIYSVDDDISLAGGNFSACYINGESGEVVYFTADMLYSFSLDAPTMVYTGVSSDGSAVNKLPLIKSDISSFTSEVGTKTVYLYYEDSYYETSFIAQYDIDVIAKATSIEMSAESHPDDDYILGEEFSLEGWEVLVTYSDGTYSTENDFTGSRWSFEGTELTTTGQHTIRLFYGYKEDNVSLSFVCNVHNDVVRIDVEPFLGYATEGDTYDFSSLHFVAVRENGSSETIPVSSLTPSLTKAGSFVLPTASESDYERSTFVAEGDWEAYRAAFYVKEGDVFVKAGNEFDETAEYYHAAANLKEIVFTYNGRTTEEYRSPVVSALTVSRKIESVSILTYPNAEYVYNDEYTEWDLREFTFEIAFNNNTRAIVKHENAHSSIAFTSYGSEYVFTINDITYNFKLKNNGSAYLLSQFKGELGTNEFIEKELIFSVTDTVYDKEVSASSQELLMYCFKSRIISIHIEMGEEIDSGNGMQFARYTSQDTAVYLNEGLSLYLTDENDRYTFEDDSDTRRFVYDGDGNRVPYLDAMYIFIVTDNGTDYQKISEIDGAVGFSVSGYNANKTGAQTITIRYLLRTCTFTAFVRANVAASITVESKNGGDITVIEKMSIDPNKVVVTVGLNDADGNAVDRNGDGIRDVKTVDFSDVTCTYDKNEDIVFTQRNSYERYYLNKNIVVSYQGVSTTVPLTIYKKSVSEVIMQIIPQQLYPELPDNASSEENNLKLSNASGDIGTILVKYDNGSTEIVELSDGRVNVNATQFNRKVELNNGAEQSQTIFITFTDENKVNRETSYNVIVKDRKNLTISYPDTEGVLDYEYKFHCQYGTGSNARPSFFVYYYTDFYINTPSLLAEGGGGFTVTYVKLNSADAPLTSWPTQVGEYTMVVSYSGDRANNPFENRLVTIVIGKKELGISVTDKEVVFGDKYAGLSSAINDLSVLGIAWRMGTVLRGRVTEESPYVQLEGQAQPDQESDVVAVSFEVTKSNGDIKLLTDSEVSPSYLIVNLSVGEYYLRPVITILNSNYTYTSGVGDIGAKLTVLPKEIKIEAVHETKVYGTGDPKYRFNVYDNTLEKNLLGGTYYEEVGEAYARDNIGAGNLYTCDNNIYTQVASGSSYQSGTTYYVFKSELHIDPIFTDSSVSSYRLTRSGSDTDNVTDYHHIYAGVLSGAMNNYSLVSYTPASLSVLPAELVLTADTATRPYGTSDMAIRYVADTSVSGGFCYDDSFDTIFGDYFTKDNMLFYDTAQKKVYDNLPGGQNFYDDWAALYKNLSVENFETIIYNGYSYVVVPFDLDCGTYVFTMNDVFSDVVTNYNVTTNSFSFEITPIQAELNIGSIVVYEKTEVKDDRRNGFVDYLNFSYDDFVASNIWGETLTYSDFVIETDALSNVERDYSAWLSQMIIDVQYVTGNSRNYLLSYDYLNGYSFTKESGSDAGVYQIMIGYNYSDNFSAFTLKSKKLMDTGETKNYFSFYYDMIHAAFTGISSMDKTEYDEGAYVIVLPGFADLKYYRVDADGYRFVEDYDHKLASDWKLTTEFSTDKVSYSRLTTDTTDAIAYSIVNKSNSAKAYLAAGEYYATVSYDYFADVTKEKKFSTDYVYLGGNSELDTAEVEMILNYVLFGVVPTNRIYFTKTFDYTINQKVISVSIENKDGKYNNAEQTLVVRINDSLAKDKTQKDDELKFVFDVEVVYNQKADRLVYESTTVGSFNYYSIVSAPSTENIGDYYEYNSVKGFINTQDTVVNSGKIYYACTNASDTRNGFKITNAGEYSIRLVGIGNSDYVLRDDDVQVVFTINPNEMPILLYTNGRVPAETTSGSDFIFQKTYQAAEFAPIDSNWTGVTEISRKKIYFDSVSFPTSQDLGDVSEATAKTVGSARIKGCDYDIIIRFADSFNDVTMNKSGGTVIVNAGSTALIMDDPSSSETKDYFLYLSVGSSTRQIGYDGSANKFYFISEISYKTTTCQIADFYFDEEGVLHLAQKFDSVPNSLSIYAAKDTSISSSEGNKPINVKRDPETKEVIGYDIVFRDNSDYVNFVVTFVYLSEGMYVECDEAHRFSFMILPAKASLYQFNRTAGKVYNGYDAEINKDVLLINDALKADPISLSAIQFSFERQDMEGSTYITINSQKYYLVEQDDLASCGTFHVTAYFSDNYDIVFKGNNTTEDGKGIYTIERGTQQNTLLMTFVSDEGEIALSKLYDGKGLLQPGQTEFSGYFKDICNEIGVSTNAIAQRDIDTIYYKLSLTGYKYGDTPGSKIAATSVAQYDVGYYWFGFSGMFLDKDGIYRRYDDRDDKESTGDARWLNWNYIYEVLKPDGMAAGDDGIFRIEKRPVYLGINGQKPTAPKTADGLTNDYQYYKYYVSYDGTTYKPDSYTGTEEGVKKWSELLDFYTVYYYDEEREDFIPLSETDYADLFDYTATFTNTSDTICEVSSNEKISLGINNIQTANGNFDILNTAITIQIKPIEIEIQLTFTNVEDNNASQISYGETIKENAVNFTLSISDEEMAKFNQALKNNDPLSASQILNEICNINNARFYLANENDAGSGLAFTFIVQGDTYSSAYVYDEANLRFVEASGTVYQSNVQYYSMQRVEAGNVDRTVYYKYYEQYEESEDVEFLPEKRYFIFALENVRAGNRIPEESYYVKDGDVFVLTNDTVFLSDKEYYSRTKAIFEQVDDEDIIVGAAIPAGKYFTKNPVTDNYVPVSGTFEENVIYYRIQKAADLYEFKQFYKENEDVYFLVGNDYFTVTKASTVSRVGSNVKANTYYEYDDIKGIFMLTTDKVFREDVNYYTIAQASVVVGARAITTYYILKNDGGNKYVLPTASELESETYFYFFTPTAYTSGEKVTEYYYYYYEGKFYNLYKENPSADLNADTSYYVAYVYDKKVEEGESAHNANYYVDYEKMTEATGVYYTESDKYYQIVKLKEGDDGAKYNTVRMLIAGKDYQYGDIIQSYSSLTGKTVYESVPDTDAYFATKTANNAAFVRTKTYYVLEPVTNLVAGDDVSNYYVVTDSYSHADHTTFNSVDETYYKPVLLTKGVDYVIDTLIPANTYFEQYDGGNRYDYSDDMFFKDGVNYYVFVAVKGIDTSVGMNGLFVYNEGNTYKMRKTLVPGKDYVITTLIEENNKIYYRSGDRFIAAAMNTKYKRGVEYYTFGNAPGYISYSALGLYYVDASAIYTARVLQPDVDYTVGDTLAENVVAVESLVPSTAESRNSGKVYFIYDNNGYTKVNDASSRFVSASGFYSAQIIIGDGTTSVPTDGSVYEENSSLNRYVPTTDTVFVSAKTYYRLTAASGYINESDLSSYFVDGSDYFTKKAIASFAPGNSIKDTYPIAIVCTETDGRLIPVSDDAVFAEGESYYILEKGGMIRYSQIASYYIDGKDRYSLKTLSYGSDYSYGNTISANVYVYEDSRYVRPSELTYQTERTYYRLDNRGYILNDNLFDYAVSGMDYYSFTLIEDVVLGATIETNVFLGTDQKFTATSGTYQAGTIYYRRSNSGLVFLSDDSDKLYVDATGYYEFIMLSAGESYIVGDRMDSNIYEIDSKGVYRITSDTYYLSGKTYYERFSDKTYIKCNLLSDFYLQKQNIFSPRPMNENDVYSIANAYVVSDYWYQYAYDSSKRYQAGVTYIIFETQPSYMLYGDTLSAYKKYDADVRFYAIRVDETEYAIGADMSSGYYTMLDDGRLIAASGKFMLDKTYYRLQTGGFAYSKEEDELFITSTSHFSIVSGDATNAGYIPINKLGTYYVVSDGYYSVSADDDGLYEYFKDEEYIRTTDVTPLANKNYFSFTALDYVQAEKRAQSYVVANVLRAKDIIYEYYTYGGYIYDAGSDGDYYLDVIPKKIFECSGGDYLITEDTVFLNKDYYCFIPQTEMSTIEKVGGLYVHREGYAPVQESFAGIEAAKAGVDYRINNEIRENDVFYIYTEIDQNNDVSVPQRVAAGNGKTFSAGQTYYKMKRYYRITQAVDPESTYGLYEYKNGVYVLTGDSTVDTSKTYYRFSLDEKLRLSDPIKFYEKGIDGDHEYYVQTSDFRIDPTKEYYYFKSTSINGKYSYATGSLIKVNNSSAALTVGSYFTAANDFSGSGNYTLKVVSTPFEVKKQVIKITGMEREFFSTDIQFILSDDTRKTTSAMNILENTVRSFILEDKSEIYDNVGSYYDSSSNTNYYVNFNKSLIDAYNNNKVNNYYLEFTSLEENYIHVPLYIKRKPINVSLIAGTPVDSGSGTQYSEEIEYGINLDNNDLRGMVKVTGSPNFNQQWTDAEVVSVNQRKDEYDDLVAYLKNIDGGNGVVIDYNAISQKIASTPYTGSGSELSLQYNLLTNVSDLNYLEKNNKDDATYRGFGNYWINFGDITYTIAQRTIYINVAPNTSYYSGNANIFSILYSDINKIEYAPKEEGSTYLTYNISIDDFTSGRDSYTDLDDKMVEVLGDQIRVLSDTSDPVYILYFASQRVEGGYGTVEALYTKYISSTGYTAMTFDAFMEQLLLNEIYSGYTGKKAKYYYKDNYYADIMELLVSCSSVVVYNLNNETDNIVAGLNRIALSDSLSDNKGNYKLVPRKSDIYIYPEIESVGEYRNDTGYINLVADTVGVIGDTVTVDENGVISGLDFMLRLNMGGMSGNDSVSYVDANNDLFKNEYDRSLYTGIRYERNVTLYYVSGGDESGATVAIRTGMVLTVKAVVEEKFSGSFGTRPSVETMPFKVRVMEKNVVSNGTMTTTVQISNVNDVFKKNAVDALEYGKSYSFVDSENNEVEFELIKSDDEEVRDYDLITFRARFTPRQGANVDDYFFKTVLYENTEGRLELVIRGGTQNNFYIRFYPTLSDVYFACDHATPQADVTYYKFKEYGGQDLVGQDLTGYYIRQGEAIYPAGTKVDENATYYTLSNDPSDVTFVAFSEDLLPSDNLKDIFDGDSHCFTIYLDRVGYLDSLKLEEEVKENVGYYVKNATEFDFNRTYFTVSAASLSVGDELYESTDTLDAMYFVKKDNKYIRPSSLTAEDGVTYYQLQAVGIFTFEELTLPGGTALYDGETPLYYVVRGDRFVKPTESTAIANKNYYTITQNSGVGAYTDYYIYLTSSDNVADVRSYYFNREYTTYTALRKYYVYISVDGDISYSERYSSQSDRIVTSFIGGIYKQLYYSEKYNDGTTEAERHVETILQDAYFYTLADGTQTEGSVSISFKNLQPIVSYFTLKKQYAHAVESIAENKKLYAIRNITLFPDEFNTSSSQIIVTKSTLDGIVAKADAAIRSVRYLVTSGSSDNSSAVTSKMVIGNGIILEYNTGVTGGKTAGSLTESGLYKLRIPMTFYYSDAGEMQYDWICYFLVADAYQKDKVSFRLYNRNNTSMEPGENASELTPTTSKPIIISSSDSESSVYYFNNLDKKISEINSNTIVFDVDFSTTRASNIMLYLGLSTVELFELDSNSLANNPNLWGSSGLGLYMTKYIDGGNWSRTTRILGSTNDEQYYLVPSGSYYQSGVTYWKKDSNGEYSSIDTTDKVGKLIRDDDVVYTENSVSESIHNFKSDDIKSIDWERGRNILKVDFVTMDDDALIVIRLYQYYYSNGKYVTDFVWQEYIRANETGRGKEQIKQIVDNIDFVGIKAEHAQIKLYEYSLTAKDNVDFNFVKTTFGKADAFLYNNDVNSDSSFNNDVNDYEYVDGHTTFKTKIAVNEQNNMISGGEDYDIYMLADEYNIPYAYTGNAVTMTFSLNATDYVMSEFGSGTNIYVDDDHPPLYYTSFYGEYPDHLYAEEGVNYYYSDSEGVLHDADNNEIITVQEAEAAASLGIELNPTPLYDLSNAILYSYENGEYVLPSTPKMTYDGQYYYNQKKFILYFGGNTPYIGTYDVSSRLNVRGLAITLNQNQTLKTDLTFSYYKYNHEYIRQTLFPGMDLADGEKHTITAVIGKTYKFNRVFTDEYGVVKVTDAEGRTVTLNSLFSETARVDNQTLDQARIFALKGFYIINVYVDGQMAQCVCPYMNDTVDIHDLNIGSAGNNIEGNGQYVDNYFLNGIYYTGVRSAAEMTIDEYYTYSVK